MSACFRFQGRVFATAFLCVGLGCTGRVGGNMAGTAGNQAGNSGGGESPGNGGSAAGPGMTKLPGQLLPVNMPRTRLSPREYDNTIADLLGDNSRRARSFDSEIIDAVTGFPRPAEATQLIVQGLTDAAEGLAVDAMKRFATLVPCSPATPADETACARKFIAEFGRRTFRRPLSTSDETDFFALYQNARGSLALDFKNAIRVLITAFLQSPEFLYHDQRLPGAPPPTSGLSVKLGAYELASRLSYLFWRSMPDDELLDAAASGTILTPDGLNAQIKRMLEDPHATSGLHDLFDRWLGLDRVLTTDKSSAVHPEWNVAFKNDLYEGAHRFIQDVVQLGDGRLSTLLTATQGFVSRNTASLYGLSSTSAELSRTPIDTFTPRAGLFTQGAILATYADPTRRGLLIRKRLLCDTIVPPANIPEPPHVEGASTRERLLSHVNEASCKSCHQYFDPIGFGFLHYDDIGKYRETEGPHAIDATGILAGVGDEPAFDGAVQMMQALARASETGDCAAKQVLTFAIGGYPEETQVGGLRDLVDTGDGDLNLRNSLSAIASSRILTERVPSPDEVKP